MSSFKIVRVHVEVVLVFTFSGNVANLDFFGAFFKWITGLIWNLLLFCWLILHLIFFRFLDFFFLFNFFRFLSFIFLFCFFWLFHLLFFICLFSWNLGCFLSDWFFFFSWLLLLLDFLLLIWWVYRFFLIFFLSDQF